MQNWDKLSYKHRSSFLPSAYQIFAHLVGGDGKFTDSLTDSNLYPSTNVLSAYLSVYHMNAWCPQGPEEYWIPWNWSYWWLWTAMWALEIEPRSSGNSASALTPHQFFNPFTQHLIHSKSAGELSRPNRYLTCLCYEIVVHTSAFTSF